MTPIAAIAFLTGIAVISGCGPTQQQFEIVRETIRGSSKAERYAMNECVTKGWNARNLHAAAMIMDTTEKAAPRLACSRVISAMKSGRLQYADAAAFKRGRPTPEMIKIIQGR